MARSSEVLVIGAGPAGIASAIAARLKGFEVTVADFRRPPIDKACGEGLLPEGVSALRRLGIYFPPDFAHPFFGLRFRDPIYSASALFPGGPALGIRRTALHKLLLARAEELNISFLWGARLTALSRNSVRLNQELISYKWLVGADGHDSQVRKFAGLDSRWRKTSRLGFRRHFEISPWSNVAEVYWGGRFQIVVTPTGCNELCLSLFTSDSRLRLREAIAAFPALSERLRCASALDLELGSVTSLRSASAPARGRVALVGDASCTVDGIAGQGLSLAFQQAHALADAIAANDLPRYAAAHRSITRNARRMTRLLLLMNNSPWIRAKTLRLFAAKPALFSRMISLHAGAATGQSVGVREVLHLTLEVLGA